MVPGLGTLRLALLVLGRWTVWVLVLVLVVVELVLVLVVGSWHVGGRSGSVTLVTGGDPVLVGSAVAWPVLVHGVDGGGEVGTVVWM
eukprot:TRINITY_DN127348_c0_g1_i1.p2 TRINITY_DN127348_c0_g1~~TRINITY_DN127348_c0_g1_i1.p2  ORF type:complete len:102 (-),score=3.94 TRINITY_DN127348_c0_g1_i1:17-277(-)